MCEESVPLRSPELWLHEGNLQLKMKKPLSPPEWTNPSLIVIRQIATGWEVSKPNVSHGIRIINAHTSLEGARQEAHRLASQLNLWVVEYDRDKRKLRDTRPLTLRFQLGIERLRARFESLRKFTWWVAGIALTALITLVVEASYQSANAPAPKTTKAEGENVRLVESK